MKAQTEEDRKDRAHLLATNARQLDTVYLAAKEDGCREPVLFVMDMRDTLAAGIAGMAMKKAPAEIAAICTEYAAQHEVPTLTLALPRDLAREVLRNKSPNAERALGTRLPPATFMVVVIAAGGVLYAGAPVPAHLVS